MRKKLRRALTLPLALVFLLSGLALVRTRLEQEAADAAYQEAAELAGLAELPPSSELAPEPLPAPSESAPTVPSTEEPSAPDPREDALRRMDLAALRAINEEVLGWLLIPDVLSYPVMAGADNEFYLDHTWDGSANRAGAIFLDCRSGGDLDGQNTILYGHRANGSAMFGRLDRYAEQAFRDRHPLVYLSGDDGTQTYEIFAAYEAALPSDAYEVTFHGDADYQAFLDACAEQSVIASAVDLTPDSRILTLSTCTGRGHDSRWVVHAVLRETERGA